MSVESILGSAATPQWLASPEADRLLGDPSVRQALYRAVHPRPGQTYHGLLQALLEREVEYRSREEEGEAFENLYHCAFLLFQLGHLEDVLPMWRAKHVNFDTGAGFDIQFLAGAGVDKTLEYLGGVGTDEARQCRESLLKCKQARDFDALGEWSAAKAAYFS